MPDIDEILSEIEAHRVAGTSVDDLTASSVLTMVRDRSGLERLFAGTPHADQIVDRVDRFLGQDQRSEMDDSALIAAATGHLRELQSLLVRLGTMPDASVLVDAVLALPCTVVSASESSRPGVQLRGVGEEVTTVPEPSNPLTPRDLEHLAGIEAWTISEMAWQEPVEESLEYLVGPLHDHALLAYYLVSPGLDDPFDFDHYFRLWEAGATLWISAENVEIRRDTAPRWEFDQYGDSPATPPAPASVDLGEAAWLEGPGRSKGGAKALDELKRCVVEQSESFRVRECGLSALPPAIAQIECIKYLSLYSNRFTRVPAEVLEMRWLKGLDLEDNEVRSLEPELFASLPNLVGLNVSRNRIMRLPEEISTLVFLETLDARENEIAVLPDTIGELGGLTRLFLDKNSMQTLPPSIGRLQNLELFHAASTELATLPVEILDLPDSVTISFWKTQLPMPLQEAYTIADLRAAWPSDWPQPS